MTLLDEIASSLGVYRKVHVIDRRYHRPIGNLNELNRHGRSMVVGTQMQCGARQRHSANWTQDSIRVEMAHQSSQPCPTCFPAYGQLDLFRDAT
jgi:hypothetical protein